MDIVETIDNALEDYALSPDAMRWTPEPVEDGGETRASAAPPAEPEHRSATGSVRPGCDQEAEEPMISTVVDIGMSLLVGAITFYMGWLRGIKASTQLVHAAEVTSPILPRLLTAVGRLRPGQTVTLKVTREGTERCTVEITEPA